MVFFFRSEFFFRTTQELEYFLLLSREAQFFFQNLTLGYTCMTKTLNQIFFFLHQNQNIFFSNIGNQNIFLEKNHTPPLPVKWSIPKKDLFYLHGIYSIQFYLFSSHLVILKFKRIPSVFMYMYAMNIQNDIIGLVQHENCKSKQMTDFIAWPSRCHDTMCHGEQTTGSAD